MGEKALEPRQLVVELGTWLGIAIRRIEACHQDSIDRRLDVARLGIRIVARQRATNLHRLAAARKDRDAVVSRLLPLPQRAVPCVAYRGHRKFVVVDAQLLQAHDVRFRFAQPLEQAR